MKDFIVVVIINIWSLPSSYGCRRVDVFGQPTPAKADVVGDSGSLRAEDSDHLAVEVQTLHQHPDEHGRVAVVQ